MYEQFVRENSIAISYTCEQAFELHIHNSLLFAAYEILVRATSSRAGFDERLGQCLSSVHPPVEIAGRKSCGIQGDKLARN